MNRYRMAIFLLIAFFALTACSPDQNGDPIDKRNEIQDIPTPTPGKANIYGVIVDSNTGDPIAGVPFLAHTLSSDNPDLPVTVSFSLQNDPGANYDSETGFFIFENIDPDDNYAIIVVTGPGNTSVVKEDGSDLPLIISIEADDILDLGEISIEE